MRKFAICISVLATLGFASLAQASTVFEINGGGFGHGIGMSQYGAYGYALHGKSYQFILSHYYQGTAIGKVNPARTVRVLLDVGSASFSGVSRATAGSASKKLWANLTYSVRVLSNGKLALYKQSGKRVGSFAAPLVVSGPGPLELAGHGRYRGNFEFRPVGSEVQTVNAIGLDNYVRGVVAAEMPASWAMAALEAQAVAARTYALTGDVGGNGYQLYPDTRSQMYGGVGAETSATNAAVAATSGQILTYHGSPATAYFFSSSGGYTESIQNVWLGASPEAWLRGVPDPYDGVAGNPYHRWSYRMSIAAAGAKLGSLVKGRFRGIRVTKRGVSPRVVYASVVGTGGSTRVTGPQLEEAFGLPSTYMRFITISSTKISRPKLSDVALAHVPPADLDSAVIHPSPELTGSIFPASKGSVVTVQRRVRRGWRTVGQVRLGAGGAYDVSLASPGTYRVKYGAVPGPSLTIG